MFGLLAPFDLFAYSIGNNGIGCQHFGIWDEDSFTCTMTNDSAEPIYITGTAITLNGNGYTVDVSDFPMGTDAVWVDGAYGVTVENSIVRGGGINFDTAGGGTIFNNEIYFNGTGLELFNLDHALVQGNVIQSEDNQQSGDGVYSQAASDIRVIDNVFSHLDKAVVFSGVSDSEVTGNIIENVEVGMLLRTMSNNRFSHNSLQSSDIGIDLDEDVAVSSRFDHNQFNHVAVGVKIRSTDPGGPDVSWLPFVDKVFLSIGQLVRPAFALAQTPLNVLTQNNFMDVAELVQAPDWMHATQFFDDDTETGNYWSDFDEDEEGCFDETGDGICDEVFEVADFGLFDFFPQTTPNVVASVLPECSDGEDNDGDGLVDFPEDPGCLNDADWLEVNAPVPTCQMYISPNVIAAGESANVSWTSTGANHAVIDQGVGVVETIGSVVVSPLETTTYTATFSGAGGEVACSAELTVESTEVDLTLGERAAALAKKVVAAPYLGDGDTYGGKGWDGGQFVSPETIFSGYNFWNNKIKATDFGSGLDCSGLVMWSFNRANDPNSSHKNNVVLMEGADGQYRNNVEQDAVSAEGLWPGDLLFFSADGSPDNFKNHVAMYVGGDGPDSVVEAATPQEGIIFSDINEKIGELGFIEEFRRLKPAVPPKVYAEVASPVDLVITDPEGITIGPDIHIQTDLEYLREIPGEWYYSELIQGGDGRPADWVYSYNLKNGVYMVKVIPDETVTDNSTYSLRFTVASSTLELATDELVSSIPPQGFAVAVSNNGSTIEEIDVPAVTPESLFTDLKKLIKDTDIEPRFLQLRLEANRKLAEKQYKRGNKKAAIVILKNLDGLVKRRINKGINETDADEIREMVNELRSLIKYE